MKRSLWFLRTKDSLAACVFSLVSAAAEASERDAYLHLERFQDAVCRENTSRLCQYDSINLDAEISELREGMRSVFSNLTDEAFAQLFSSFEGLLEQTDRELTTKYDFIGQSYLYNRLYNALEQAALVNGVVLEHRPALGSLIVNRIDAAAIDVPNSAHSIIALNTEVFDLANEISKTVSETMVRRDAQGGINIDTSYEFHEFDEFLSRNPTFVEYTFSLVIEFLGFGGTRHIFPSHPSPITNGLRDGLELFVVAHEKSHLLLGHEGDLLAMNSGRGADALETQEISWSWAQEVQADIGGSELLFEVADRRLWDVQYEIEHDLIARGGVYFFFIYLLLEEAAAAIAGVEKSCLNPRQDHAVEFSRIVESADATGGVLFVEDVPSLKNWPGLNLSISHPPAQLRSKLQRELYDRHFVGRSNPQVDQIYATVEARLRHMFDRAMPAVLDFAIFLETSEPETLENFRADANRYLAYCEAVGAIAE